MSKMSEIAMELDDQAAELGFDGYEDAIERGGYDTYFNGTTYVLAKANADEQEVAHEAWLKEKKNMLDELCVLYQSMLDVNETKWADTVDKAIKFIERGEL